MSTVTLWKDKDKGLIDPLLFSDTAELIARKINGEGGSRVNNKTQLRRFFDEIIRLHELAQARPEDWQNILPLVHMMAAKAAYAQGRKLISESFLQLVRSGVKQVQDRDDLNILVKFFESFIGFYEYESSKKNTRR